MRLLTIVPILIGGNDISIGLLVGNFVALTTFLYRDLELETSGPPKATFKGRSPNVFRLFCFHDFKIQN